MTLGGLILLRPWWLAALPLIALAWPARIPRAATPMFVIATGVLWAWHLPQAYDAAMADKGLYWIMQATLLGSATAFWRAVLAPGQPAGQVARPGSEEGRGPGSVAGGGRRAGVLPAGVPTSGRNE